MSVLRKLWEPTAGKARPVGACGIIVVLLATVVLVAGRCESVLDKIQKEEINQEVVR